MNLAPIIIFCYSRPQHLTRVLNSLLKCTLIEKTDVFFYQDGLKTETVDSNHQEVSTIIDNIQIGKSKTVVKRAKNFGLAKSIINGVSEILETYDKTIVIEDDLIVSPTFLTYMNSSLDVFQNNWSVGSICGFAYKVKNINDDFFFLKGANPLGWGTWRNRWKLLNLNNVELMKKIKTHPNFSEWDYGKNLNMLNDQINQKIDSWLISWHTSLFLENKLTLFPKISFINHIGFDNSGTHQHDFNTDNDNSQYDLNELNKTTSFENIRKMKTKVSKKNLSAVQKFHFNARGLPYTNFQKIKSQILLVKHKLKCYLVRENS